MATLTELKVNRVSNIMSARTLNTKQKKMPLARLQRRRNPSKEYREHHRGNAELFHSRHDINVP